MKQVHFDTLEEIASQFGECKKVDDPDSGIQIGWQIETDEEQVSFNFTEDAVRMFNIAKKKPQSKYKCLELLKQCLKKAGLHDLVFYRFDGTDPIGEQFVKNAGPSKDGLDEIETHYKVSPKSSNDIMGGSLMRVGSRRR